ncbi:MAG: hypothetical protein HOQ30_12940 [Gemmatimonadaceae bacterium]|nr:hypothetical protein [Gemmatimonadaceae bacterium]NUR34912.1 hypothetical protein [Gemmatimonadaceae bacterium]
MARPFRRELAADQKRSCTRSTTVSMVSFTTPAASAACCRTAPPTRFTRSTGDWALRVELLRAPPELFRAEDFFAPAERVAGRFEPLFPAAPRAVGRRAPDDFFLPLDVLLLLLLLALRLDPRLAPRLAPPRFADPRFAPPFFAPPRLPALLPPRREPPRDDLAFVAIVRSS